MRKAFTLCALLLGFLFMQASAQDRTITGKVISSQDNLGIPGVSVVVSGTTIGTVTDKDGKFSIAVSPNAKTLRFSSIGMKTKDVQIGASNSIDVTLDQGALKLEEVVVTANAIVREKRSLGYSTQQVSGTDLNAGENSNVIGALQGKVAGVNITSLSGAPGSSQRIVIRGGSSITGRNQPIFVVDGIIIDNANNRTGDDLNDQVDYGSRGNDINPDDIESISVLKGPAAAALYGSVGSNGAIMISTKKGRRVAGGGSSKMDVTLHSGVTFSTILKLPTFQNSFGQGDIDNTYDDRRENFSWGLPFDGALRPWGQEINGKQRVKEYKAIENNMRDFFNTGVAYDNSLSFSGGSEKSDYFLSVASSNSKGIVPTKTYDKYSIHFNASSELSNKFTTGISLNYSNISSNLPSGGQSNASIYDPLLQTPRDIPIVDGKNLDDPFNAYNDVTGQYGFYGAYTTNPYFVLNNFLNTNNVDRVIGNVNVTYNGWNWLSVTDRFGGDIYADRRYEKWKKYSYTPIDPFYSGNNKIYQGKYGEDLINYTGYNNDLMLNFKHKFNDDISGNLLIGNNIKQIITTETTAQTNEDGGLGIQGYYNLVNSNGPAKVQNTLIERRIIGYYADLNLDYKNLIFLNFTWRRDQTSTFKPENNTYYYPSVNASFILSELFNSNLKDNYFNYCKIRASYAKVGGDADPYRTTSIYARTEIDGGFGSTIFPFGGVNGYTTGDRVGNPELKPEFSTELEIGTDVTLLKERVSIGFSYYKKDSKDEIIDLPLPSSTGFTSKTINTGELTNDGIELEVRGIPVQTKSGFKWEAYGTYFKNTNKVKSLYLGVDQLTLGGTSATAIVAQVGQPAGSFYSVDLLKDNQGRVVVDSVTGMPQLTTNRVYVGNYQPKFQASFGSNFSFKGFTFGFLFDMKDGGQFSSRSKDIMDFVGTAKETVDRADHIYPNSVYLSSDGQYVVNNTQKFHPYNYYTNVIPAGQQIVNAGYKKLREIHLSYNFPGRWLNKTPFGSASLTIFGNNMFIWTDKGNDYSDPEQNSAGSSNAQGFEFTSNPSQRNYGVDLKVTF